MDRILYKRYVFTLLLFLISITFAQNLSIFPHEGAGESVGLSEDTRIYSVVGLPFSGVSTSGDDILFSGILNTPIVIEMMLNDTPVCTNFGPVDSALYGNVSIPYTVYDVTFDTLSFVITLQDGDSTYIVPDSCLGKPIIGIDSSKYSDSIVFLSDKYFPGLIVDSVRIGLTPKDKDFTGKTIYSTWFSINNAADMNISSGTPLAGSKVTAFEGKTISINLTGSSLDTSSFTSSGLTVTGSITGAMPFTVISKTFNQIIVTLNEQPYSGESITVTLLDTLYGVSGKSVLAGGIGYSWSFSIGKTGDFNGNDTIADLEDIVTLADLWQKSQSDSFDLSLILKNETGPAVGTAPKLKVAEDSLFNYSDLLGFLKMWQWKTTVGRSAREIGLENSLSALKPLMSKEIFSTEIKDMPDVLTASRSVEHSLKIEEVGDEYIVSVSIGALKNITAGEYLLWYDKDALKLADVDFSNSIFNENENNLFVLDEKTEGYIRLLITKLADRVVNISGPGEAFKLIFTKNSNPTLLTLKYALMDIDKNIVEEGIISPFNKKDDDEKIKFAAVPSPAVPSENKSGTEISDDVNDLVELTKHGDGVVLLFSGKVFPKELESNTAYISILIYDAVGNVLLERFKIPLNVENGKKYGYYWNGQNQNGRKVASGAYKALLKWECGSLAGLEKTNIGIKGDSEK